MTVVDQDFPCTHPSTSARNYTVVPKTLLPPSSSQSLSADLKQWENVGGLTFDEDIGGGDVDRAVSGAVAAVRSCVPHAQLRDRQSAAGCARMMSGIALLHLYPAGWERPVGVRQCPVQLAVAADRRNREAAYEACCCKTNLEHSFQLCLNSQPFHFRMAAAASPMGTLSLDVHVRFILSESWIAGLFELSRGNMFFLNDVLSYTFFPHSIHFKTLIKEIPEEHQTCLAYHCLTLTLTLGLPDFGSRSLQPSPGDRKQASAVWLSIRPCREALHWHKHPSILYTLPKWCKTLKS